MSAIRIIPLMFWLVIAPVTAMASIGALPPADMQTIGGGMWEGITIDEPRLFVFHLDPEGSSSIDMAVGYRPFAMHYRVTSLKVAKGAVTISGVSTGADAAKIRITGKARAVRAQGRMPAEGRMKVKVLLGSDGDPATWDVEMVQRPGGYLAHLWKLHEALENPAAGK